MTKSQINKLGQKLRTSGELDADTLAQLQEFRASFDEPMFRAQTQIRKLGFEATSRLKTINTIIEKLRREKTRLAEMQDIAGLRIVSKVDLTEQDTIVSKIVETFSITKVIDRRKHPTHGYRAVHVIATLDERHIEIQDARTYRTFGRKRSNGWPTRPVGRFGMAGHRTDVARMLRTC